MNLNVINSALLKKEFSFDIVDLKFGQTIQDLEKFSIKKVFTAVTFSAKIFWKLIKKKRDIVYFTFTPTGFGFYRDAFYVCIVKMFSTKVVLHLHGKGINKALNSPVRKWIYTQVFRDTALICLSEKLTADVTDVYSKHPFVVPNGIAVNKNYKATTRKDNHPLQILFVSNLILNKGVMVLVDAMELLHQKGFNFQVRFVGAPSNVTFEMLDQKLHEKQIAHLATIVGPLYGEAKFVEYNNADIFVFPTYNDAFGLVILEAMQHSLPVVSTYEGSIPDIVTDQVTGFLVNREDAVMLAERISELLTNETLRLKMGNNGYERFMSYFTIEHFEENLYNTFKSVLSAQV